MGGGEGGWVLSGFISWFVRDTISGGHVSGLRRRKLNIFNYEWEVYLRQGDGST